MNLLIVVFVVLVGGAAVFFFWMYRGQPSKTPTPQTHNQKRSSLSDQFSDVPRFDLPAFQQITCKVEISNYFHSYSPFQDTALEIDLINTFFSSTDEELQNLTTALQKDDQKAAELYSHAIKGAAKYLAAYKVRNFFLYSK